VAVGVSLLGCTGSIGRSALSVLSRHTAEFRIVALASHRNCEGLIEAARIHSPDLAVIVDDTAAGVALDAAPGATRLLTGRDGLLEAAAHPDADIVINAVVGAAGLEATLAALRAGKRLALANKESLVAGGPLVMNQLAAGGGQLVPVDSEHSAILQCLAGENRAAVRRVILTASGGPFREASMDAIASATPAQALRHPTWDMGAKITVDSASLANKALEVIETHFLFGLEYDAIEAVVHPQSIIHSMVEFVDGSIMAQMGFPNMELPILYALTWPERRDDAGCRPFDPIEAGTLTFQPVDGNRFPTFRLGIEAGRTGGTAPAVFNAANEVAVAGFLSGRLPFGGLAAVIDAALSAHMPAAVDSLETVLDADRQARELAADAVRKHGI
jgi:1-deoxy-D-xylulose-5-phosphate reductoisomerase